VVQIPQTEVLGTSPQRAQGRPLDVGSKEGKQEAMAIPCVGWIEEEAIPCVYDDMETTKQKRENVSKNVGFTLVRTCNAALLLSHLSGQKVLLI
jgi:hypothetical protein